jgi:Ca-activated chloride channel family protein
MSQAVESEEKGAPVRVEVALSHNMLWPGRSGSVWALVKLVAGKAETTGKDDRLPLNLALVLDRSGSMSGDPLEYVKESVSFVVDQVASCDLLSIITFDQDVDVICPSQNVANKDGLKKVIKSISSGGSTNLSGGFLRGYREVLKESKPGKVNRILLLTDGEANVGITEPSLLADKAKGMAEKGVSVSTVGVGAGFNEDLLMTLAEAGQGHYYYVSNPDEIPKVFVDELEGLLSVIAQAISVSMEGLSGCHVAGVLGYEPVFTAAGASMELPDMYENEVKILALQIDHPPFPPGEHGVFRLVLDYAGATGDLDAVTLQVTAKLTAASGPEDAFEPNFEVIKVVELIRTAVAKDESAQAVTRGDFETGRKVLQERLDTLSDLSNRAPMPDVEINDEINEVNTLLESMDTASPHWVGDSTLDSQILQKELKFQSYQTRRSRPKK